MLNYSNNLYNIYPPSVKLWLTSSGNGPQPQKQQNQQKSRAAQHFPATFHPTQRADWEKWTRFNGKRQFVSGGLVFPDQYQIYDMFACNFPLWGAIEDKLELCQQSSAAWRSLLRRSANTRNISTHKLFIWSVKLHFKTDLVWLAESKN